MSTGNIATSQLVLDPGFPMLEGRTGRGVPVAIIDSGAHPNHPHVGGIVGGIAIRDDGVFHGDWLDRLGHGTAVAAAIHEKAPGASLIVIRVFHERLTTNVAALIDAVDWAVGEGVRLINLSLGTANPDNAEPLAEAAERAAASGTLIVSARADGSRQWYPGSLPRVVGVDLSWETARTAIFLSWTKDGAVAAASGYPRPIAGVDPARNLKGVSFAVANTTGILARLLEDRPWLRTTADLMAVG